MAEYSPIEPADDWFRGEHKILRFTLPSTNAPITGWNFDWHLYPVDESADALLHKSTGSGVTITEAGNPGDPDHDPPIAPVAPVVQVEIQATDTADVDPRTYQHVLRRTDAGDEGVLSYGPATLKEARSS